VGAPLLPPFVVSTSPYDKSRAVNVTAGDRYSPRVRGRPAKTPLRAPRSVTRPCRDLGKTVYRTALKPAQELRRCA
jgi:hypothetical protein